MCNLRQAHGQVLHGSLQQKSADWLPSAASPCYCGTRGLRRQGKYDDSTWRCPGESADSRAGDWLLAGGCHSIPKQSTICSGIVVMRTKARMGERGGDNAGCGSWNAKEVIFSYENVFHWLPPPLWRSDGGLCMVSHSPKIYNETMSLCSVPHFEESFFSS